MRMTKKKQKENLSDLSVDELIEKWRQIKTLLDSLEDDYRKAEISESAYKEAKVKNQRKFKQLTEILAGWGITKDQLESKSSINGVENNKDADKETASSGKPAAPDSGASKPVAVKGQPPSQQPAAAPAAPASQAPAPAAAPPSQPGVPMDVIEAKVDAKIEKINANIDTLKEANTGISERMQAINESIGELRSQGSQRESVIKDVQSKAETVGEEISSINPEKYSKALEKRDKTSGKQDMRIEKLEMKTSEIAKTTGDIRKLLESIGGLENVSHLNKEMGKKLMQAKQLSDDTQKLANRVEKIFVQLNKRMEDFAVYQSKQENLEGVVKDIIKSIDAVSMRMDDYVTIENFDNLKKSFTDLEIKIGTLQEMIGKVIPVARMKIPQPVRELQEEKEAIQSIMESMEDEYTEGKMKKESYDLVKEKNVKKLQIIEDALRKEWKRFEDVVTGSIKGGRPVPDQPPKTEAPAPEATERPTERPAPEDTPVKAKPAQKTIKKAQQKPVQAKPVPASKPIKQTKPIQANKPAMSGKPKPTTSSSMMAMMKMEKGISKKAAAGKSLLPKPKPKKATKPKSMPVAKERVQGPANDKDSMLAALEDSYKSGALSKEAYEKTKKMLGGK
jgi:chromosome segregation ATPase